MDRFAMARAEIAEVCSRDYVHLGSLMLRRVSYSLLFITS